MKLLEVQKESLCKKKVTRSDASTSKTSQPVVMLYEALKSEVVSNSKMNEEGIIKSLQNLNLPVTSLTSSNVYKPPLQGFVKPSQGLEVEHDDLPTKRTNGFDPNAYKLLFTAGYGQENTAKLAKEEVARFEMSEQNAKKPQLVWKENNQLIASKAGVGYSSVHPLHLKSRRETSQHITFEEIEEDSKHGTPNNRTSVFNRLGDSSSHISVFDRIDNQRLENLQASRASVHARIEVSTSKGKKFKVKKEHIVETDSKDIHSKFPSRMKRHTKWVVTTGQVLKRRQ